MQKTGFRRHWAAIGLAAAFLLLSAAPAFALTAPRMASPADGVTVGYLPAFAWYPVSGADKYEFEIATDSAFNSPIRVDGLDSMFTKNTRATLKKAVPNGTLYWHVRAVNAAGSPSAWSTTRWLKKAWLATPTLVSPVGGVTLVYPTQPVKLTWSAVPRASHYRVTLSMAPSLASPIVDDQETAATTLTPSGSLPRGQYYWAVTPTDAQGNRGKRSVIGTFRQVWPSAMSPAVADLLPSLSEVFDPQFSWPLVPGASRYEVEVNSSSDFASGSKVCCSPPTLGAALSPTSVFANNRYYWRARAVDPDGNAGVWTQGTSFDEIFDSVPAVPAPSVKNVRMRDNLADPGTDVDPGTAGYQTQVPVVTWDPVPGASSYQVEVTLFRTDLGYCDWGYPASQHWTSTTATNAWTPLGNGWVNVKPYLDDHSVATDPISRMVVGNSYCARVRARRDRTASRQEVYGDYTYLNDGSGSGFAFQLPSYPAGGACSPSCNTGYLGSDDSVLPITGVTTPRMPYFTWKPLAGKRSYYVLVSKDASFSTIVDYAFVQIPAYAPRSPLKPTTYSDETTLYYWAVLPAAELNGSGAVGDPLSAAPQNFQKQSVPPTLLAPVGGASVSRQPVFRWTKTEATRVYHLQVSSDPSFANPIDDVTTDSTAYTSNTTYPADTVTYWRVQAMDENLVGLTWSPTGTFRRRLTRPVPSSTNPTAGSMIPTFTWAPITGAVSYDVAADLPDGTHQTFTDYRSAAFAPVRMTGTGIFGWRVRANYPKSGIFDVTHGPYSATRSFTRTIPEPSGLTTSAAPGRVLLGWQPGLGINDYKLQISTRPDFSGVFETVTTDNTSYAPLLTLRPYEDGGAFYWRVAGVDEDRNVGDFSDAQQFGLPKAMRLSTNRYPVRYERVYITITVRDLASNPVGGASVKAWGGGITSVTKTTGSAGSVTFRIRATKLGSVYFTASKSGYKTTTLALPVQ